MLQALTQAVLNCQSFKFNHNILIVLKSDCMRLTTVRAYCYSCKLGQDFGRVGRLRATSYGLEDMQAAVADFQLCILC